MYQFAMIAMTDLKSCISILNYRPISILLTSRVTFLVDLTPIVIQFDAKSIGNCNYNPNFVKFSKITFDF